MEIVFDRITRNPEVMNGQPCVRGMRLTVRRVLEAGPPGRGEPSEIRPRVDRTADLRGAKHGQVAVVEDPRRSRQAPR